MKHDKNIAGAQSGNKMANDTRFGGANANRRHQGGSTIKQVCPHCGSIAKARTSRAVTPLFRELRFQCTNVDGDEACGHTFVCSLVIERTIVPSARPNPRINLSIAPARMNRTALPSPTG